MAPLRRQNLRDSAVTSRLPLPALLSQALVAFTIEFDNAAEQQIQHYTTRHGGSRRDVWLVSMAMWLNCMRYVGTDPVKVADIASLARCGTNLDGMRRWGYLTLEPDRADSRPKPPDRGPAGSRDRARHAGARGLGAAHRRHRATLARPIRGRPDREPDRDAAGHGRSTRRMAAGLPADPRLRSDEHRQDPAGGPLSGGQAGG